jgi:hypothetical protein
MRYPLMRFLTDLGSPLPKAFYAAAEFILNTDMRKVLSVATLDVERAKNLLDEARKWNITLDAEGVGYLFKQTVEDMMDRFVSTPEDILLLQDLVSAVELARSTPFEVDLRKVQDQYHEMLWTDYPAVQRRAKKGDETAEGWVSHFVSLGEQLSIQIPKWSV